MTARRNEEPPAATCVVLIYRFGGPANLGEYDPKPRLGSMEIRVNFAFVWK